jgi:hypothetical protein
MFILTLYTMYLCHNTSTYKFVYPFAHNFKTAVEISCDLSKEMSKTRILQKLHAVGLILQDCYKAC